MSPHFGCYGETTIRTPNIDRLAGQGARFTNAYVTAPVCSPSRSAMITGMYQTTIGAHHHRSSWKGSEINLPADIKLLPEYFRRQGYYVVNGGPKTTVYHSDTKRPDKLGKTDYNFVWDGAIYDGADWKDRAPGQPFFAQIQLRGGKYRSVEVPNPVDPAKVKLPPYYPDHPVLRRDWARYLNSVIYLDMQIGKILKRLDEEGIADDTAVFFWTDHGISHARGKQFLYDEGIRVPLIIRWPGAVPAGKVRRDMVSHIDIAATSLYFADIPIPKHMQGRPLFGPAHRPRRYVFAARDRCDETLDCIRAVRDGRYKYIRNFYPDRCHLQPNRYKDNKEIIKTIRRLYAEGKLDEVQRRLLAPTRPREELYDTLNDPYEIDNLAGSGRHREVLERMRRRLLQWMKQTKDLGLVPESILGELSRSCGTAYDVLRQHQNRNLLEQILEVIELGERGGESSVRLLVEKLRQGRPSVRWWAARKLGNKGRSASSAKETLIASLRDDSAAVRVESARALCKMGFSNQGLPVLVSELENQDQIVRHYAALALEDIGQMAKPALEALEAARSDKYEYVRRIADRLVNVLRG